MKHKTIIIFFLITVFIPPGYCLAVHLSDLEKQIDQSVDSKILSSEIEQHMSIKEKTMSESGIKLSGSTAYGWNREPISLTQNDLIEYEQLYGQISLVFPIFGSQRLEQTGILKAEKDILFKKYAREIFKKNATASLRKEYINLWISGKKLDFIRHFLHDEVYVTSVLKERIRPGLLLKTDFHEFMTQFDRVKREEVSLRSAMERSQDQIYRLTSCDKAMITPEIPDLPAPILDIETFRRKIRSCNAELAILDQIVTNNNELKMKTKWSMVESHVDLSYAPSRTFPGAYGNGASVSINVKTPLNLMESNRLAEKTAELEITKSRITLEKIINGIMDDYRSLSGTYQVSLENLEFAGQRLATAYEGARETRLRLQYLRGDVFEKFVQARYAYFNAVLNALDAQADSMKTCADLLMVADNKEEQNQTRPFIPEKLPGYELRNRLISSFDTFAYPAAPRITDHPESNITKNTERNGFGVYVWDSLQILTKPSSRFWEFIAQNDVNRLLISFDRNTINQFRKGRYVTSLKRLIRTAGDKGIIIELLLGEPSWIYPDKRKDLLNIINVFREIEFGGIHLDIEPDQLPIPDETTRETLKSYVIDTLKDVQTVAPWPVSVSMHPRYFENTNSGLCMGCELEAIGINEVTLMIYMSDIGKVAEKAKHIMKTYPLIRFSIAQSIEPELPSSESHGDNNIQLFMKEMKRLDHDLSYRNYNSLVFQSLKDMIKASRK